MSTVTSFFLLLAALDAFGTAHAQIARSSSVGVTVTEAREVASAWSVKKSILGRTVYNEANQKIGVVQDLVIAPDRSVSYLIIGAGGFVGMNRHDVAVPITQITDRVGKIAMPGGSRDAIKAMPTFEYAYTSIKRDEFVANAEWNINTAKEKISDLETSASAATDDATISIHRWIVGLQQHVSDAEEALGYMQQVDARRWKEFEKRVAAAIERLQKTSEPEPTPS